MTSLPKSLLAFLVFAMTCSGQESQPPRPSSAPTTQPASSEFASADLLLRQGKYDEAITELQSLAAKNPAPKNLTRELGVAYYQKGDYLKAAEYLKTAQSEDPKDNESIQLLGLSYYLAGRPADARPPSSMLLPREGAFPLSRNPSSGKIACASAASVIETST